MSIYDIPEFIYVVAFKWKKGGASGGDQCFFSTAKGGESKLRALLADDYEVSDISVTKVRCEVVGEVPVYPPMKLRIEG